MPLGAGFTAAVPLVWFEDSPTVEATDASLVAGPSVVPMTLAFTITAPGLAFQRSAVPLGP